MVSSMLPVFAPARKRSAAFVSLVGALGLALGVGSWTANSAYAQDAKRGDDGPSEEVESFYGDAQQSVGIQVPGYRGLEPNISLRYRSSRRDDLLGVGWTLGGFSSIEAASPRRGTPNHNSNDIFILDGQELVACETGMVSPSCETGGTHTTKIESYRRIKLDDVNNTWEIWNREGTKITLEAVAGQVTTTPVPATIYEAHFDSDAEGFSYADDLFGSANYSWYYADGVWADSALNVSLGGLNSYVRTDMSGGWSNSFTVTSETQATLSFTYRLDLAAGYEADEFSRLLLSFDGGAAVTVAELTGGTGADQTTGLQTHTEDLGVLAPGTYTFSIGGYNNKKSYIDEVTSILIDDVVVTGTEGVSSYNFSTTYRWAVSEVTDTHGNTVSYSYFNDGGEAYPETVSYNVSETNSGSEIKFHWEGRPDAYSRAIGPGGLIETNLRLKTVDVQNGGQRVRAYALSYDAPLATTEEGLLQSVQLYGKDAVLDANGTVTSGTSLPPTSFTYYDDPASFAAKTTWSTAHSGQTYEPESVQYADVNGDNLVDRIFRNSNNLVYVSRSDGAAFVAPTLWASPGGTYKTDQDSYADINGDGMADMVFRKSDNQVGVYLSDGAGFLAPASWNAMGGSYYAGQVNVGDVDGDGRADLVFVGVAKNCTDQTLSTLWGACNRPFDASNYLFCPSGYSAVNYWTTTKSCSDGDRLKYHTQCQSCLYTEKLHLGLSNGAGFDTPVLQYDLTAASTSDSYHNDRVKLADVNGDGRVDVSYRADGNDVKIGMSDGDSILPLAAWHDFGGTYEAGQLQYADVNGDGTADAIFHPITAGCSQYTRTNKNTGYPACDSGDAAIGFDTWTEEAGHQGNSYVVFETTCEHCSATGSQLIQVSLSTGSDFITPETWFTGVPDNAEPDLIKFADFDGDGRADLSYRSGSNAVTVALSTGTQFTTLETLPAFNGGYKPDQIQLADVNGDGKDDVVHRATDQTTSVALSGPAATPAHALESVTNVYGGAITYAYTPSSAWANANLPFVVNTVTSVAADDGRGLVSTTTYDYAGGLWDAPERRFLGFRTAIATLPCIDGETACPTATTTFIQDYGAYSKPEKIERFDGAGTPLSMVEHLYELNGATIPYTSLNEQTTRTLYAVEVGDQDRRTRTTRDFDFYANVTESTFHGDLDLADDEVTSISEFNWNTDDYIVSLPVRQSQHEGVGAAGTMLTESFFYYDGAIDQIDPPSLGDLTKTETWDNTPPTGGYITSKFEYDGYGNVTATVDPLDRRSVIVYDPDYHLYPAELHNPLSQVISTEWDTLCGLPLTLTDLNGGETAHTYDDLCRGVRSDTPAGNFSITSYVSLGDPGAHYVETQIPHADGASNIWAKSHLDGWGRQVQGEAKGPIVGQEILQDSAYNLRGGLASTTQPYYFGDTSETTAYSYDASNRQVLQVHPDGNSRGTTYGVGRFFSDAIGSAFSSVTSTDEVGHTITTHSNAYGQVVRKEKALDGDVVVETYSYDLLGRLTGLTDNAGNTWTYTYNSLGLRLSASDPDLGASSYVYDEAGQLTSQTDAKGQITSFTYDVLGRVLTKTVDNEATGQVDVTTYIYDEERGTYANIGRLTTAHNSVGQVGGGQVPVGVIKYDHDADGRVVRTTYTIDNNSYVFKTELDVAGRILWQSYPEENSVVYSVGSDTTPITYDAAGRMSAIPDVITSAVYDARGAVTEITRANDVTTTYDYSAERGWLEGLVTEFETTPTPVQDFTYQRQADGQITGITSSSFIDESWTYAYDDLKRLTAATNATEPDYDRTYEYDSVGNITNKSDVGEDDYIYGSPQPHAVSWAGGYNYTYDENGNMVEVQDDAEVTIRSLVWDGEDRPTEIDGVTFHYGPDGARWKKVDTTGAVTLTLGAIEIQDAEGDNPVVVKYLPGSARRTDSGASSTTLWHHKDHLNSIQAVTDANGIEVLRRIHAPYGERVFDSGASFAEAKGYIGERLDGETGLLYLNARYYDPVMGVFISGDPSDPLAAGVGVNRYAYAGNNPVLYSDPYGLAFAGEQVEREMAARGSTDMAIPGVEGSGRGYETTADRNARHARERLDRNRELAEQGFRAAMASRGPEFSAFFDLPYNPNAATVVELRFREFAFDKYHGLVVVTDVESGMQVASEAGPFGPMCDECGFFGSTVASTDPYTPESTGYFDQYSLVGRYSTDVNAEKIADQLRDFAAEYNERQVSYDLFNDNSNTYAARAWEMLTGSAVPSLPVDLDAPGWPGGSGTVGY